MEDILLVVAAIAFFASGYFVTDRFGRILDEVFRGYQQPEDNSVKSSDPQREHLEYSDAD